MKPRTPLNQMGQDQQPTAINGKPADVCPNCGCAMFAHGTKTQADATYRYVHCRNNKCGKRFLSKQLPAKLIREVGGEDSSSGQTHLTVVRQSA
jgi:hypothetical protein